MKIYFVRHGETDMNKNNMFYGWYDADINEKGVSQAEELRDAFKDIHIDEEGRIWMAVFPYSITVFSDKYPEYKWMQNNKELHKSQASSQITYLLEDSDGDIWMTTSNGICYYNTRTKQWKDMLTSQQQDKHEQNYVFISLCEPTPGTILVGGYMSGMYRINKKDMRPQYFSPQAEGYTDIRPDKYIRSIYRDEEGNVWAGGYYNFKRINLTSGDVEHYSTEYPITYITSKNKEELWVGTINGLYKFNKRSKQFLEVSDSVNMGTVNTIFQDGDQNTYIGTHGTGLWVYDYKTKSLTSYDTQNSALLCNNIYCILPGSKKGELIISTENELVCFKTKEKVFKYFNDNIEDIKQSLIQGHFVMFMLYRRVIILQQCYGLCLFPHVFQTDL